VNELLRPSCARKGTFHCSVVEVLRVESRRSAAVTSNVTLEPNVCLSFICLPLVVILQMRNFPKTSRCNPSVTRTICIMSFIDPIGRPFVGILIFWYNIYLLRWVNTCNVTAYRKAVTLQMTDTIRS